MIYLLTKYFLSFANYEDNDDEIDDDEVFLYIPGFEIR